MEAKLTDIIDELRGKADPLSNRAADEIERLEFLVETMLVIPPIAQPPSRKFKDKMRKMFPGEWHTDLRHD